MCQSQVAGDVFAEREAPGLQLSPAEVFKKPFITRHSFEISEYPPPEVSYFGRWD
jgi:hypothetical protein